MDKKELQEILEKHKQWLSDNYSGEKANLSYADLSNADLRYAVLTNADLTHADLSNVDLRYAVLTNADLTHADLRYANLTGADLTNVDLRNANLRNADLADAYLTGADLRGAYLSYADLRNAYLKDANLTGANLVDANLSHADLSDADLTGAKLNWCNTQDIIDQKIISVQVDTTRKNNQISYWAYLDIWTAGCFQGSLDELKTSIEETHKDNEFLKSRYYRVIDFIMSEAEQDKVRKKIKKESVEVEE